MWKTITAKSIQDTCFPEDLSEWLNQPPKISGSSLKMRFEMTLDSETFTIVENLLKP